MPTTVTSGRLTLLDWAKKKDADGKTPVIVEMLEKMNPILSRLPFVEGNLPTGHQTTIRTGLPTPVWRKYNQGVQPSKGSVVKVTDGCGMLSSLSECDAALANLASDKAQFRLDEAGTHMAAMMQEHIRALIYGDITVNPEEPLGLAARYPYKDSPNVVDFGNAGGQSVYVLCLGKNTVHGIFPKGSKAGVTHTDMTPDKPIMLDDGNGGKFPGYQDYWELQTGLCIRDWRYAIRFCNIAATGSTNNFMDKFSLFIRNLRLIPIPAMGQMVILGSKEIGGQLDDMAYDKVTPMVYTKDVGGEMITHVRGIPFLQTDALADEDEVAATP